MRLHRLILVLLFWSCGVVASDFNYNHDGPSVFLGAWSHHLITEDYTNETHNLLAVEYDSFVGGYFENSYSKDSFFLSYSFSEHFKNFESFALLGGVYGYTSCYGKGKVNKRICPMIAFGLSYTKYQVQPTLLLLGDAVAASVRIQF